jgi:hypothetical protein
VDDVMMIEVNLKTNLISILQLNNSKRRYCLVLYNNVFIDKQKIYHHPYIYCDGHDKLFKDELSEVIQTHDCQSKRK